MKYTLNIVPDLEEILIKELKQYLFVDIKFAEIFPNFGNVRISATHPFAFLLEQEINGDTISVGLFPSVTLVNTSDTKNQALNIPSLEENVMITTAEVADMENNRDMYIISEQTLVALKELVQTPCAATGFTNYRRANLVGEIWSENPIVKNKLYDIVLNFLIGQMRFTIRENYGITIIEDSIQGEKNGNYNYDFGKMLFAAILRFDVDFTTRQYVLDSETEIMAEVDHYENNITR